MIREVLRYPHPGLKQVCREAEPEEAERVARDLIDTMRSFPRCVGVAAPQIGELLRIAVVDCTGHPKVPEPHGLLVLVNPAIVTAEGSKVGREGCLSIPDLTANVRRAKRIEVAGEELRVAAQGFEARVIQHELDHLDGLLFLDRVVSLTDDVFRRQDYAREA